LSVYIYQFSFGDIRERFINDNNKEDEGFIINLEVKMELLPRFHPPPRQCSEAQTDRH
jgi:hypothetical protein